jgi:proliferating cell nuclear antigen
VIHLGSESALPSFLTRSTSPESIASTGRILRENRKRPPENRHLKRSSGSISALTVAIKKMAAETPDAKTGVELRFRDGALLRRVVDAVKELVLSATIIVSPDEGMRLEEMDSSHVSLISAHFQPAAFDRFSIDRTVPLGVDMVALSKMLRCGSEADTVTWRFRDGADHLDVRIEAPSKPKPRRASAAAAAAGASGEDGAAAAAAAGRRQRACEFRLKLMDIEGERLSVPDTGYSAHVFLRSAVLLRLTKQLAAFGESVRIEVSPDAVSFQNSGDKSDNKLILPNLCDPNSNTSALAASFDCFQEEDGADAEEGAYIFTEPGSAPLRLTFALKYLNAFAKSSTLAPHVQLSLSDNVPLVVRYPLYTQPAAPDAPAKTAKPAKPAKPANKNADRKAASDAKAGQKSGHDAKGKRPASNGGGGGGGGERSAKAARGKDGRQTTLSGAGGYGADEESGSAFADSGEEDDGLTAAKPKLGATTRLPVAAAGGERAGRGFGDLVGQVVFYLAPRIEEDGEAANKQESETATNDGE